MVRGKNMTEKKKRRSVHCITNPVTMQDVANVLLAAGGSAIMAQDPEEAAEITAICDATLLNTGVPDREKFLACERAGRRANELGHPVILDPVGVGASSFRKQQMKKLLETVKPSIIRCNQEEAVVLLGMLDVQVNGLCRMRHVPVTEKYLSGNDVEQVSGGVESNVRLAVTEQQRLAEQLAAVCGCAVLISGVVDVISNGTESTLVQGGDPRIPRITGSGCMLSALCGLLAVDENCFSAALGASKLWKKSAGLAGEWTDRERGGMGSFHRFLFDAVDLLRSPGADDLSSNEGEGALPVSEEAPRC